MTLDSAPAGGGVRDAESLLDRLAASALDDDYYQERPSTRGRTASILSAILLGLFGFVIAVVAVETQIDQPATEVERQALISSIAERQEVLDARRATVENLQDEIGVLSSRTAAATPGLAAAEMNAAAVAVNGEGIEIVLASSADGSVRGMVSDADVQLTVNGLWMAGAEAIDVGGHRLTSTSAIRAAGEGITVNFRSLAEPIVIRAIGSQRGLEQQLRSGPSGRYLDERATVSLITWTIQQRDVITMKAAPAARLNVRHANAVKRGE